MLSNMHSTMAFAHCTFFCVPLVLCVASMWHCTECRRVFHSRATKTQIFIYSLPLHFFLARNYSFFLCCLRFCSRLASIWTGNCTQLPTFCQTSILHDFTLLRCEDSSRGVENEKSFSPLRKALTSDLQAGNGYQKRRDIYVSQSHT